MTSADERTGRQALLDEARCVAEEVDDLLGQAEDLLIDANLDKRTGCIAGLLGMVPFPGVGEVTGAMLNRRNWPGVFRDEGGKLKLTHPAIET